MSAVVAMERGRSRSRSGARPRKRSISSAYGSSMSSRKVAKADRHRAWYYAQGMSKFFDPFPSTMRAMLRYSETFVLQPTLSGTNDNSIWRANSINDPRYATGGHQPYGHDTYQAIYNHYMVLKSVITLTVVDTDHSAIVGITGTDDASVQGNYDTVREVKPTKCTTITPDTGGRILNFVFDQKAVWGGASRSNISSSFGTNPPEEHYFHIWAQASSLLGTGPKVTCLVNIVYYCEFSELRDLGQS